MIKPLHLISTFLITFYFFLSPLSTLSGQASQTPTASIATWKDNKKAAYTIIHDDYSDYIPGIFQYAYPLSKARGMKICFGAITNFCGVTEWNNAKTMIADGNECVNHSHNHKCGGTAGQCAGQVTYGPADFATELGTSSQFIETKAGVKPRFFVHPYDAPSESVINYLKSLGYLGSRAGTQLSINNSNFTDFMHLNYYVYDGTPEALAGLNPAVDAAIAGGGYVLREFHGVDDEIDPTVFKGYGPMTLTNYTNHLNYVKTKIDDGSIWSATVTEAITYKMQRDAYNPLTNYDVSSNKITVSFANLKTIDPSVLTTPVTVNVNVTGITGNFDALQGTTTVASTRTGNIMSFNVYPHQGSVILTCNNCTVTPPVITPILGCLKASYFTNIALTGIPAVVRAESKIDNNWGNTAPVAGIAADNFSVRWEGIINPPISGSYIFTVVTDDGVRLWVNNQLIIDKWQDQSITTFTVNMNLTQGQSLPIKMEYYEKGGNATAQLSWTVPTQASRIIAFEACPIITPPTPVAEFSAAKCYRMTARHSGKVMEIANSFLSLNGIVVSQDSWTGARGQVWRIKSFDGTHYQISNGYSGKFLTVANSSTADLASIYQYTNQNANSQKWKFEKNTEGYYFISPKHVVNKVLDVNGGSTANGARIIQYTKTGSTNQQWAVAEVGCPLGTQALESNQLIAFEGHLDNHKAVLQWVVKSDEMKDYYDIEKADETHDFQRLTTINDSGTTPIRSFSYADETLADGDSYYRLKSVAFDGSVETSAVIKIAYKKLVNFDIFPNPASDNLTIDLSQVQGKNVELTLISALGKTVFQEKVEKVATLQKRLSLDNIENGQYFLKIQTQGSRLIMQKVVVLK